MPAGAGCSQPANMEPACLPPTAVLARHLNVLRSFKHPGPNIRMRVCWSSQPNETANSCNSQLLMTA